MSVSIDYFFRLTDAISNKNQSGQSLTIAQKNIFANSAQLAKFEADRQIFISTGEITKYLTFFMKNVVKQVPPTTGYLSYPDDWEHTIAIRSYYTRLLGKSAEIEVKESKDKSWGEINISSLLMATKRFPKYMEFANEFRFLPKDIGTIYLDYLKTPTPPIWGYLPTSPTNPRPVYNPLTSVDFEFEEFSLNEVAMLYLQLIGCNLSMPQLNQFASTFKAESSAPL